MGCQEATYQISESLDHATSFFQRFRLRLHLLICKLCSRYRDQVVFLHNTLHGQNEKLVEPDRQNAQMLSGQAKQSIARNISSANQK